MFDQLLRSIPTDQIARALGEDPDRTREAVSAALPALVGGLTANAEKEEGARSLLSALGDHEDGLADNPDVDAIDTTDGGKIVNHVFGGSTDDVVSQLGGMGGGGNDGLIRKLLPILAPIVLSWLAGRVGVDARQDQSRGTSVLQDVLGQVLAGATGQQRPSGASAGSILTDLLGGLLGGRR